MACASERQADAAVQLLAAVGLAPPPRHIDLLLPASRADWLRRRLWRGSGLGGRRRLRSRLRNRRRLVGRR
eukprot:14901786-Alexandrium_andersonii.AAC.1